MRTKLYGGPLTGLPVMCDGLIEQIEAQTQDYNVLNDNFTTRKIVNRGVLRRALR